MMMKTTEEIHRLLDQYWTGDTSLEEESALKTFFSENDVPEELKKYQPLFLWKTHQLQIKENRALNVDFKKPVRFQWYPFLKIAASVLLVLVLSIGFYTSYQQEKYLDSIFTETYSNPEDALQTTKNVIGKISSLLNLAKDERIETQMTDSLEHVEIDKMIEE